ncbi:MAG: two-component system histidine kinase PnpS, partial [Candidatus Hinthialibacter sp.]
HSVLNSVYLQILMAGLAAAVIAAVICLMISQKISRPLWMLKEGADRIADGNLNVRLTTPESEEMGHVATAMNKMVEQLDNRIQTINRQRRQQEAIFASMIEGVLAVDKDKRIITMNQAAANLLHISLTHTEDKLVADIIDDPDIFQFIDNALAGDEPLEAEIVLGDKEKSFLQMHGSALLDSEGERIGAVVVMHDITTLRRLENIRRDFVANVSHELKTPITSIKGFVETLMDGALSNPDDAMRFLGIISRQADRLNSIIEDLLSLSRIEQDKDKASIPLEFCSILSLMKNALECCKPRAAEKQIALELVCDQDFSLPVNPPLLEQAVLNLTDNAIKYSDSHTTVRLEVSRSDQWAVITVQDWGCGIEQEHLPRIFERFYRVDKARSRKLGGTGLGLAIVKHITQAHGGFITVDSELGKGSAFSIHLPFDAPMT